MKFMKIDTLNNKPSYFYLSIQWNYSFSSGMEDGNSKINPPLRDFYIPDYMLVPESKKVDILEEPTCPVVVFINSRSGGQLGGDLIKTYRELLNHAQVLNLKMT